MRTVGGGGGALPTYLREAHITVYTPAECKKVLDTKINDGHVCIGDVANKRGSCNVSVSCNVSASCILSSLCMNAVCRAYGVITLGKSQHECGPGEFITKTIHCQK